MANWILGFLSSIEWLPFVDRKFLFLIQLLALLSIGRSAIEFSRRMMYMIVVFIVSIFLMLINSMWTGHISYFLTDFIILIFLVLFRNNIKVVSLMNGMLSALVITAFYQILTVTGVVNIDLPHWIQEENGSWVNSSAIFKAQIGFNNKYNSLSVLYSLLIVLYVNIQNRLNIWVIVLIIGQVLTLGRAGLIITVIALLLRAKRLHRFSLTIGIAILFTYIASNQDLASLVIREGSNLSRLGQFNSVMNASFSEIGILGRGFAYNQFASGAIHVHNFFLNSYVAMGPLGILWSLIFFLFLILRIRNLRVSYQLKIGLILFLVLQTLVENINVLNMSISYILFWSILFANKLSYR